MQNDPNKRKSQGGGQPAAPKTSYVGKTAAERRAERRGESVSETTRTGTAPAAGGAASGGSAGRTIDRRAERERERKRQRLINIAAIIGVVLLVIIGLILVTQTPDAAPIPDSARARYGDLIQSRNTDGYPLLGNATAPVVVTIYSAFDCLTCKELHDQLMDPLVERVRAEAIAVEFVPLFGRAELTNGQGAAVAAVCAAQQNQFWAFHDALYSWIGQFPNNLAFRDNRIDGLVNDIGLDGGQFAGCRGSGLPGDLLERARVETTGLPDFPGAPAVAINGVIPVNDENQAVTDAAGLIAAIDEAVGRVTSVNGGAEATPEATPEATEQPSLEATAEATSSAEATDDVTPEPTIDAVEPTAEPTAEATPSS